jgi:hypothetical protein
MLWWICEEVVRQLPICWMGSPGGRKRLLHQPYKKSTSESGAADTLEKVEMPMLANLIRRWAVERRVNRTLRAYCLASSIAPAAGTR